MKNSNTNRDEAASPIARLVQMGRQKNFVTSDDILKCFPNPENDIEQLDRVYAALISAGIPYIDTSERADELLDKNLQHKRK